MTFIHGCLIGFFAGGFITFAVTACLVMSKDKPKNNDFDGDLNADKLEESLKEYLSRIDKKV